MAHTVLVPWHLIFCRARFTPMNLASERNNHFALLIIGMNVLTQIAQANSLWISNFNTERCIKAVNITWSDIPTSLFLWSFARVVRRDQEMQITQREHAKGFVCSIVKITRLYDYQTCIAEIFLRFFFEVRKGIRAFFYLIVLLGCWLALQTNSDHMAGNIFWLKRLAKRSLHH